MAKIAVVNILSTYTDEKRMHNTIVRFPIRYMDEAEFEGLRQLREGYKFIIGQVDFTNDDGVYERVNVIDTESLQEALELIIGPIPLIDVSLN